VLTAQGQRRHREVTAFALLGWPVAMLVPEVVGILFPDYTRAVAELDLPGHAVALFGH
jgi:hypothetical protein